MLRDVGGIFLKYLGLIQGTIYLSAANAPQYRRIMRIDRVAGRASDSVNGVQIEVPKDLSLCYNSADMPPELLESFLNIQFPNLSLAGTGL